MRRPLVVTTLAVVLLTIGTPTLAATSPSSLPAGLVGKSAAQIIATSRQATLATTSMRVTLLGSISGVSISESGQIGATQASQTESYPGIAATGSLRVIKNAVYLYANAAFLGAQLSASQTLAKRWANQWLSITPSSKYYASYHANTTLASALSTVYPTSKASVQGVVTFNGVRCVRIVGALQTLSITTYVSATAPFLYEGDTISHTGTPGSLTMTASQWGQAFTVLAPPHATDIATTGL